MGPTPHRPPFYRDLNGLWKFHWVPTPQQRPRDFFRPDFDDSGWPTLPVPSVWELQGYGTPIYSNVRYPYPRNPPYIMTEVPEEYTAFTERNPVGSYRREFTLPPDWAGREVFIHFGGAASAFYLWINGEKVGYSQESRTPAEFRITPYVKPGSNLLAVEVYRWCDGSYLEDQDFWRLSGIFREVFLFSTPPVQLRDFGVRCQLDEACRDAVLHVTAKVRNLSPKAAAHRVAVTLWDAAGQRVGVGAAAGNGHGPGPSRGRGDGDGGRGRRESPEVVDGDAFPLSGSPGTPGRKWAGHRGEILSSMGSWSSTKPISNRTAWVTRRNPWPTGKAGKRPTWTG